MDTEDSPINVALRSFEATEANLEKLERIFGELRELVPSGICYGSNPKYDELSRAYMDVIEALPTIDGWKPSAAPIDLDELANSRLLAAEIDEPSVSVDAERTVDEPARELAEYRHRLNNKRRPLIRRALSAVIARVDELLRVVSEQHLDDPDSATEVEAPEFEELRRRIQEVETMLGSSLPRPKRWGDLRRHLHFGQIGDLRDIVSQDWPEVKAGLSAGLYDQNEPIPVEVADLGALAASEPMGTVATKLKWEALSPEGFERLVFNLISGTSGYENPAWLMTTNAPDRGRDISVTRTANDRLGGATRSRVIVQCRHWLTKSVGVSDVTGLRDQMRLWEPPRVDVLVIATSGRFSSDAVSLIEKHNNGDQALGIEMWPESHLERLLAEHPALIAEHKLR